jgi:hypothetical protein
LEGLENESDLIAPEPGEGRVVERRRLDAIKSDGAGGGKIHGAGEVQQRRFSAPAAANQGHEFAARGVERDVGESGNGASFGEVLFGDVVEAEQTHRLMKWSHRDVSPKTSFAGLSSRCGELVF